MLIWGDLGQWLIVDSEFLDFLDTYASGDSLKNHITKYIQRKGLEPRKPFITALKKNAEELFSRNILSHSGTAFSKKPEGRDIANITINLNNDCNLKCSWCYNTKRQTPEMPIQKMTQAIDKGKRFFSKNASFFILGGEPFMNQERLLAAVQYGLKSFRMPVLVSTNGTLIKKEVARKLAAKNLQIQISLDSPYEEKHDAVRGAGSYRKAVRGVKILVDAGVYTVLSMVYTRDNYHDIEEYFRLAETFNVNEVRFIPLRLIGRGLGFKELMPNQISVFRHLIQLLKKHPGFFRLLKRDFFTIAINKCRYSQTGTNCGLGRKVIFVDADGKVYPCPNFVKESFLCGDLNRTDLGDILKTSPFLDDLQNRYNITLYSKCRDCHFRFWCSGDCRAEALAVSKSHLAPSPHCQELQSLYKEMFWLIGEGYVKNFYRDYAHGLSFI